LLCDSKAAASDLRYGDHDQLEALVESASRVTNKRLVHVLQDQYHIREHFLAMKHYLLLGQGDFIQHLMDLIAPELSKPAHYVFTEKLRIRGILETAIRGSNAQFDPLYVLENLDIQLLEPSPSGVDLSFFLS
jgi:gamma-tubulin complex component 3